MPAEIPYADLIASKEELLACASKLSVEVSSAEGWVYVAALPSSEWTRFPEDQDVTVYEFGPDGTFIQRQTQNVLTLAARAFPERFPAANKLLNRMNFVWVLDVQTARDVCLWLNRDWPAFQLAVDAAAAHDTVFAVNEANRSYVYKS